MEIKEQFIIEQENSLVDLNRFLETLDQALKRPSDLVTL